MSNIQTGAERMPHDLSHLGFLAGQIGRLITISTTPVIAGDSFEMDAVGALRLSPLRRGLAIDSTVDIFTFYVPHRHVYGEQWIKFMKDGVNATPLPTVNTTGYIDHAAFLGTIKLAPSVCRMTFPILASLLVRLVVLLPFQLLRLSLATPSRWTPLALSVFLHCVVALLLTLL